MLLALRRLFLLSFFSLVLAACDTETLVDADPPLGDDVFRYVEYPDPDTGECLHCPAMTRLCMNRRGCPLEDMVLFGSAQLGHARCLRSLLALKQVNLNIVFSDFFLVALRSYIPSRPPWYRRPRDGTAEDAIYFDNFGTALMAAVRSGDLDSVRLLVEAGAAVCSYPCGAFDLRLRSDKAEVLAYLDTVQQTAACQLGFFVAEGSRCEGLQPCDEGHYCPGSPQDGRQRAPCPAGTYGPHPAMSSAVQCRPCPASRPYSVPGSAYKSECSSGGGSGQSQQKAASVERLRGTSLRAQHESELAQ